MSVADRGDSQSGPDQYERCFTTQGEGNPANRRRELPTSEVGLAPRSAPTVTSGIETVPNDGNPLGPPDPDAGK